MKKPVDKTIAYLNLHNTAGLVKEIIVIDGIATTIQYVLQRIVAQYY